MGAYELARAMETGTGFAQAREMERKKAGGGGAVLMDVKAVARQLQ